jgi:pimeloyl-ACP methyl ester carboxylesterase
MGELRNDKNYHDVPREYVERIAHFRSTHPLHHHRIEGVEWKFIRCGSGDAALLILGGAMSTAETSFNLIEAMEGSFRIVAPSYPISRNMGAFLDGLAKLLDVEGIDQIHVFGHSLGAGIGHTFIRRNPEKVDKLILSSFGLYNERNLRLAKRALFLFNLLPYGFVKGYYKRRMPRLLSGVEQGEKAFYLAYTNDVLERQHTKKTLMSQFRLLEGMFKDPDMYGIDQPVDGTGRVLIIHAKDDTGFDPGEQVALRQSYPNASVHIFEEGGHLSRATHRSEYDAVLLQFLQS